jgi:hypothetical protein
LQACPGHVPRTGRVTGGTGAAGREAGGGTASRRLLRPDPVRHRLPLISRERTIASSTLSVQSKHGVESGEVDRSGAPACCGRRRPAAARARPARSRQRCRRGPQSVRPEELDPRSGRGPAAGTHATDRSRPKPLPPPVLRVAVSSSSADTNDQGTGRFGRCRRTERVVGQARGVVHHTAPAGHREATAGPSPARGGAGPASRTLRRTGARKQGPNLRKRPRRGLAPGGPAGHAAAARAGDCPRTSSTACWRSMCPTIPGGVELAPVQDSGRR